MSDRQPVATTLLSLALGLSGAVAYQFLPVAPMPQVDFPAIAVSAVLPGASPETMASSVATPLERQFGRIAGVNEMTSSSSLGSTAITLQFDLDRNIDAAARVTHPGGHQRGARPTSVEPAAESKLEENESRRHADHFSGTFLRHDAPEPVV